MILFILLITMVFQYIGKALDKLRANGQTPTENEYILWGLGCAVLVHIFTWLGITYTFDQTYVIWFMQLAAISSLAQVCLGSNDIGDTGRKESIPVKLTHFRYKKVKVGKNLPLIFW